MNDHDGFGGPQFRNVVIVGTGHVGLVTGACLAEKGHNVTCVDIDPGRIQALLEGRLPFSEPDLGRVVRAAKALGHLKFDSALAPALSTASIAILTVGTPAAADGTADLSFVQAAAVSVAAAAPRGIVLVISSTVPPGTGDLLAAQMQASGRQDIEVVNSPEFLAEGTAVRDFLAPRRLVFGGPLASARLVASLWTDIRPEAPRHFVDRRTAEMSKYAANAFLAVRISLINEVANLCDALGADVRHVAMILGDDSRIGPEFLRPGIGYGGSCLSKDVRGLAAVARTHNLGMPVAEAAERTNEAQWRRILGKVEGALDGKPIGKRVAILGISFKPGTDDSRGAPGLLLAEALVSKGAAVTMHDPIAILPNASQIVGVRQAAQVTLAVQDADVVVHMTEWPEYASLDWGGLHSIAKAARLLDARNSLPFDDLVKHGWQVQGVGVAPGYPTGNAVGNGAEK
ncbi:MAG: nucleotide sugar dehydrogenase [bacterium]